MLDLIQTLRDDNISIWVCGQDIEMSFEAAPSDALIATIKQQKSQIVDFLLANDIGSQRAFYQFNQTCDNPDEVEQDKGQIDAIFPATSLQQGFIYHHLSQPDDDAYQTQILMDYHLPLDVSAYQQAWALVSVRFPALRIAFDWEEEMVQVITAGASITTGHFTLTDLSGLSDAAREKEISAVQARDREVGFDLTRPGLLRFQLMKHSANCFTVLKTQHHAIGDGWSGPILWQTVHQYYDKLVNGVVPEVVAETTYIQAQRYYAKEKSKSDAYWEEVRKGWGKANDINRMLEQPVDLTQGCFIDSPAQQQAELTGEDYLQVKRMCRQQGLTLNVAVQFAWHKLIQSYTQDEQTIVGTTVSGRDIPVEAIESSVGLYINTLPLAVDWKAETSVLDILQIIQLNTAQLNSYNSVPLASLQHQGEALFHSLFVFENYPAPEIKDDAPGERIETSFRFRDAHIKNDLPLSMIVHEQDQQLVLTLHYNGSWLTRLHASRLVAQLAAIVAQIGLNPQQPHEQISLLSQQEYTTLVTDWNQTEADFPRDNTLYELFQAQAMSRPDDTALVCGSNRLTYQQLESRVCALAAHIRHQYRLRNGQPLRPDTLIALYLDRSVEMIVSMLAVLKAGAAYVPVSPEYPQERSLFILHDTQAALLITQQTHRAKLQSWLTGSEHPVELIVADQAQALAGEESDVAGSVSSAKDLAYVIYTSGTTGKPKGVLIEHRAAINTLYAMREVYQTDTVHRKASCFSNYTFDVSVSEIFNSLCFGGELHLLEDAVRKKPELLVDYINQNGINFLFVPPAILGAMPQRAMPSIQHILFAGEPCEPSACQYWAEHYALHNYYGPTEAAIYATGGRVQASNLNQIGRPVANGKVYVLDSSGNPAPVGVPGELYVGGAGIARGYLNRPELTAERFGLNPFAKETNSAARRWYKTGDLVRWLADGTLSYIGRNDSQVKIRGYRIELGEIESALVNQPGVKQAVVVDYRCKGDRQLAAYIVAGEGQDFSPTELKQGLLVCLPEYMVPASYTELVSIPLTINGKLDRNALPEPTLHHWQGYAAPENELEEKLCVIWQDILGVEQVGRQDNFFHLGGNSITAIRLQAAIRRELELEVSLDALFDRKSISELVSGLTQWSGSKITPAAVSSLSFAQERILFIERFKQSSNVYHIPHFFQLYQDTNITALKAALNTVVGRHTILRSVYRPDVNGQEQLVVLDDPLTFNFTVLTAEDDLLTKVRIDITRPFDLKEEAGIRLHFYEFEGSDYLLILCHHIAFDGWSYDIFMDELSTAYQATVSDCVIKLPTLDISYSDYAVWQRQHLAGETLENELSYWRQALSGFETLSLPLDKGRPAKPDYLGSNYRFALDTELSQDLRQLAKANDTTLYTVLLSGLYMTLASLSGQTDIVVGTLSDNRHQAQTQSLIGFFVNSLPLRVRLDTNTGISEFIRQVHQALVSSKKHQELPFEKLVDALDIPRELSRHPIFQVMFGMQEEGAAASGALPISRVEVFEKSDLYSPAKFDLNLSMLDGRTGISGVLNYAVSLFSVETIERICGLFQRVLLGFVQQSSGSLDQLNLVSMQERHTLLHEWSGAGPAKPQHKTLHELFEEQVEKTPDSIAFVCDSQVLTYCELNQRANRLARGIRATHQSARSKTMAEGALVALYLDRSVEMIVGILAVLKAGGAYVPIAPNYPKERVQYILADTGVSLLLTEQGYLDQLESWVGELETAPCVVAVDQPSDWHVYSADNLTATSSSLDLAYVIYTSGTTGNPKGVMIEHRAFTHFLQTLKEWLPGQTQSVLSLTNYTFDIFGLEYALALVTGGRLILSNAEVVHRDLTLHHQEITLIQQTPSLWRRFMAEQTVTLDSSHIQVLCGGESASTHLLEQLASQFGEVKQVYGPTETCIWSTANQTLPQRAREIGRPFVGESCYVLNTDRKLVPIGAPGELYIGGAGLARGYLNRPDLTEQHFVDNPFARQSGGTENESKRLYKTGDLVRWLSNGGLEFLGRNDSQVKILGHRIELGEVESALAAMADVQQAAVIDVEHNNTKALAAYLLPAAGASISIDKVRAKLISCLPEYMVPGSFNLIDHIPVSNNGKLARNLLPPPQFNHESNYVAPRNKLETALCDVWQEVLGLEQVGIYDSFFRIGGDSITAVRLLALCKRRLALDISIVTLFESKVIAALAVELEKTTSKPVPKLSSSAQQNASQKNVIGI